MPSGSLNTLCKIQNCGIHNLFYKIISQDISEGFILRTDYSSESRTSGNYPRVVKALKDSIAEKLAKYFTNYPRDKIDTLLIKKSPFPMTQ